jgi:hypothetical protein
MAHVMIHEAIHVWEQYTLSQLAQDPESPFSQFKENQTYYTYEWGDKYSKFLEYTANTYMIQKTPTPLCTRKKMRDNEAKLLELNKKGLIAVPGWDGTLLGYPLP